MRCRSRVVAALLLIAGCGAAQNAGGLMPADRTLQEYGITSRVGHREIAAGEGAAKQAIDAVEAVNARGRLSGLADDLNPVILDQDKVRAFYDALPMVSPAVMEKLRGRTLNLADSRLKLHAYSPIASATLAQGYTLAVDDPTAGQIARARLKAPLAFQLARTRAMRAKQAMEEADREAAALAREKQKSGADAAVFVAHSNAERKRYAASTVWRDLVTALAEHYPDDAGLQTEAARAKQLADTYRVAPWTGMP